MKLGWVLWPLSQCHHLLLEHLQFEREGGQKAERVSLTTISYEQCKTRSPPLGPPLTIRSFATACIKLAQAAARKRRRSEENMRRRPAYTSARAPSDGAPERRGAARSLR